MAQAQSAELLLADAAWSELPPPSGEAARGNAALVDSDARLGVAKLLNAIWPENGSVRNRFVRLHQSPATIFALTAASPRSKVIASGALRAIRDADGPELAEVARPCTSPCVLFSLLVDAPLQGRGLGSGILRRMEAEAARLGHSHVFLSCEAHLVGFYGKRGYEMVSDGSWKQRTRNPQSWMRKPVAAEGLTGGAADVE